MSIFVKICGLCSAEDVAAVATLRPDAMGFVFWDRSPRVVRPEDVAGWTASLPAGIKKVGVFVELDTAVIARCVDIAGLDVVQLHSFQSLEKARSIFPMLGKSEFSHVVQVWAVVHVDGNEEIALKSAASYDAVVLDSFVQNMPGGTGQRCDWNAARRFVERCARPVLLAGGLTPDNVGEAVAVVQPWGVDVSSGVESRPRVKDIKKVERFISACRN